MRLSRHPTSSGPRWALDGRLLDADCSLATLLRGPAKHLVARVNAAVTAERAPAELLAPIDDVQEVWASGVTYLSSRQARQAESDVADVHERVYSAPRPELFGKGQGWRAVGSGAPIGTRADSRWMVPEPELVLVIDTSGEIVGYCIGNDVSCRDIEGENPLYLPQAKIFDGSCALGPAIELCGPEALCDLSIELCIRRDGAEVFRGSTNTSRIKRSFDELAEYLTRSLSFPHGVLLMTGIVPPEHFCLRPGDVVRIAIGPLSLENPVADRAALLAAARSFA